MLGREKGKLLSTYVPDYVVFDLETTGFSSGSDAVIEISALKVRGGRVVGEFDHLVDPGCHIPYTASRVNGITDEMVEGCPAFEAVLKDFNDFIGDDILVGQNIHTFDMKFIYRDAELYWGRTITNDYIDTLKLAKQYLHHLPHRGLTDLAKYYGIDTSGAHRALKDCYMNYEIFERLRTEMQTAQESGRVRICPRCGSVLKKRNGKFGEFLGCTAYPECRYTENLK